MKRKVFRPLLLIALISLSMSTAACTMKSGLRTVAAPGQEISGSYTLILHGCRYLDDPETIAFLDKDGDGLNFEPYTPDFNYRIKKGLPAAEALEQAVKFVACHSSFHQSKLSAVLDDKGSVIGYELRPLYFPLTYGVDDILMTDYRVSDGRVIIRIRLIPSVEQMLSDGLNDRDR